MRKLLILILGLMLIPMSIYAYQGFIFDCDGVLVDTERLKFNAWKKALNEVSVPFEESAYILLVGYDSTYIMRKIQERTAVVLDTAPIIEKKNTLYHTFQAQGVPIFSEAKQFLQEILTHKKHSILK